MNRVEFRTFGAADLRQSDGTAVLSVLAQPKRVALLSYLAVKGFGDFVRRDTLCTAFWPDADQSQARHRLRSSLHMIRKALGHGIVLRRGDEEIGLSDEGVWFDAREFERAVDDGRHEDALEIYRGDFLTGFHVTASHEFDEWLRGTRERFQSLAAASAKTLARVAAEDGRQDEAIQWSCRAREIVPFDESALRAHLSSLDAAGRRPDALREYEAYAARLTAELEAAPAPETVELIARIRDRTEPRTTGAPVVVAGPESGEAPTASAGAGATNRPEPVVMPASSGRAAALTAAVALGGAAFFAARVATSTEGAAQPGGVSLLAYLASWLILVVGLWFLFERAEETASPTGRARVAGWLQPRDRVEAVASGWAEGFLGAFDRIFGPKHLSLHCLIRSMAASVVVVTILLLLWVAVRPAQFSAFAGEQGMTGLGQLVLITFIVNVIADYVSLLETRVALGFLAKWKAPWARAGVLVGDALATMVVWLVFYAGLPFLVLAGVSGTANDIMLFLQFEVWSYGPTIFHVLNLSAEAGGPPVGIWFYSTFLTSIWLWIYLGAGQIARAANATETVAGRGVSGFASLFDSDRQPFRVLGFVAMLIVTIAYGIGWLINLI